jgi:hypothetical protein
MDDSMSNDRLVGQPRGLSGKVYPDATVTRMVLPRSFGKIGSTVRTAWRRIRAAMYPQVSVDQVEPTPGSSPVNWGIEPEGIGICLSGGGIRSASYCLGALQSMEKAGMLFGDHGNPDRAKYLSAVSGGSYIATALTLVTKGPVPKTRPDGDSSVLPNFGDPGTEPDMRPFAPGTPEERYLRSHTLYLTSAKSGIPGTVWRAFLGVLLNLVLVAWFLGIAAIPIGWLYGWRWPGLRGQCPDHCAYGGPWSIPNYMWYSVTAAAVVAVVAGFIWIAYRFKKDWKRSAWGAASGTMLIICLTLLILGVAIPEIIHLARPVHQMTSATDAKAVTVVGSSAGLLALVLTWIVSARRIVSNADTAEKAAYNAAKSFTSKHRAIVIELVGFIGGPVLLFSTVAILAYYGAGYPPGTSGANGGAEIGGWAAGLVLFYLVWRRADVTTWSLYPFYRKRLSSAFALGRTRRNNATEPSPTAVGHDDAAERPYSAQYRISECQPANLPELIICASANISDHGATPSGSNVTSFVFSKDWVGGPLVGAVSADAYDRDTGSGAQSRFATLPTAMAISGAAFAPSMGKMTRPWLRLYMALANLRLGVWIPNPRRLDLFAGRGPLRQILPGPAYFLREIFGRNHLDAPFLYVTDGGHYENLGLVELLRRKCKTIWCIDASGDKVDTFNTIGGAFATAESELDITFAIDPKAAMAPRGGVTHPNTQRFVPQPYCVGAFQYPDGTKGTLVIVKAGVPANAPWSIRSYQAQHPSFPCDPTVDQLFDADRFDAYRELGRFSVAEALATHTPDGQPRS